MKRLGRQEGLVAAALAVLVAAGPALAGPQDTVAGAGKGLKAAGTQPAGEVIAEPGEVAAAAAPGSQPARGTLENLQAAYNGESNAHARYLAFAAKADEEGYPGAASLFRAAARSEEIHAANHAVVIRKMGGQPKTEVKAADVKSTAENLRAAVEGESYERDRMYPQFIAIAKAEGNSDAVRTFTYARAAEAGHAKLYQACLDDLAAQKAASQGFYVCSTCGNTVTAVDFNRCPVCRQPKDQYKKVV